MRLLIWLEGRHSTADFVSHPLKVGNNLAPHLKQITPLVTFIIAMLTGVGDFARNGHSEISFGLCPSAYGDKINYTVICNSIRLCTPIAIGQDN